MKKLACLIFLALISIKSFSGNQKCIIRGKISDTSLHLNGNGNSIKITVLENYFKAMLEKSGTQYHASIISDSFNLEIPLSADICYFKFEINCQNGTVIPFFAYTASQSLFLIERQDSLFLTIKKNDVSFSGRGSEKLQCQKYIYNLRYLPESAHNRVLELESQQHFFESYSSIWKLLKFNLESKIEILKTYKRALSKNIYNRIYYDCMSQMNIQLLRNLYLAPNYYGKELRMPAIKKFIQTKNDFSFADLVKDSLALIESAYYTDFLFERERIKLQYLSKKDSVIKKVHIRQILPIIKKKYSGLLRDKLILTSFLELAKGSFDEAIYFDEAMIMMAKGKFKNILLDWQNSHFVGRPSFNFSLPDTNNRLFNLRDFAGKVVVADFWFNGCSGCIYMTAALHPVINEFKENSNVVFLSINTDKARERWIRGLNRGIYTAPGQLYLSTFGLGGDHPMIKFYNYNSFPQLLVMDKKGNIISTKPPNPGSDEGKGLIELINKSLEPN